jgi:hypothetical protein
MIAGANIPDAQHLDVTIEAIVLERLEPEPGFEQHLALDKTYDNFLQLACALIWLRRLHHLTAT